jgi:metallo-beta-lactamase class B
MRRLACVCLVLAVATAGTIAMRSRQANAPCEQCPVWNAPQQPLRLFGNVYYVGPHGLGSVLITSAGGHVLIDGALPESAAAIADRIRALGFRVEDVKLIVNSHVHFDHAGGISALQRLTGATVAASPLAAMVLASGASGRDDPQYGVIPPIAAVSGVRRIADGETLRVGSIAITGHFTPGHTPGGTSWTWRSCDQPSVAGSRQGALRCLDFVYADSLTAVSADDFLFTRSRAYPTAIADFEKSFAFLATVPCDVLITPHPEASDLWPRLARRGGAGDALVDRTACRRYADAARRRLRIRIATEKPSTLANPR